MRLTLLTAADVETLLPMAEAIRAMAEAFRAYSAGEAEIPPRLSLPVGGRGTLLVKPGFVPGTALGAKLATVFPGNAASGQPTTSALMVLLDPETGEPAALLDGTFLTAWRTGAASGLATDLLAPAGARVAAVLGAGGQARTQILGIVAARPLEEIRVYAPTAARVEALVGELGPRVGARLVVAGSAETAVRGATVVCAATTSPTPVLDGTWLEPDAHVNGVGSFTPAMRELDEETVRRARVVVDCRQAVAREAGELIAAVERGASRPGAWVELGEVVAGDAPPRRPGDGVTLFKSVGLAVQDLVAAAHVLRAARERGLGQTLSI